MSLHTGLKDIAFVKNETSVGTLIVPAGTDVLRLVADADVAQLLGTAESLERFNSYSLKDLLRLRYNAATFSLQFYMKRTGTVDTSLAAIATLLKNAIGRLTPDAGVKNRYELYRTSDTLLNFSLFFKKGDVVFQVAGCFINDLSFPFQADVSEAEVFRANASGEGYRAYWAAPSTLTEAAATTDAGLTKIKVATAVLTPYDDATSADVAGYYTKGAYITVGTLGTSHKITDINPTTGVITFTPALGGDQLTGTAVVGFVPTASDSGTPVASHKGLLTYDGNNFAHILSGTIHVVNPRRALTEEKNNQNYPTADVWEGRRTITVENLRAYFDPDGTPKQALFFALADQLTKKAIIIPIGNANGFIWKFTLGNCITREPKLVGENIVALEMAQAALSSSSFDDELILDEM